MPRFVTAQELVKLLEDSGIHDVQGKIEMELNGVTVQVKQKDTIGNTLQEWLGAWLESQDIYFRPPVSSQNFPDFYLCEDDNTNLCEMKAYVAKRSPAFDIANFDSYWISLLDKPTRLDSDYLIFAYESDLEGNIKIKNIYCKKVWEITSNAEGHSLKCQRKKGQMYNIRPCSFASTRAKYKPFNNKEAFLKALYETVISHTGAASETKKWLKSVVVKYNEMTGNDLNLKNLL